MLLYICMYVCMYNVHPGIPSDFLLAVTCVLSVVLTVVVPAFCSACGGYFNFFQARTNARMQILHTH